MYKQLLTFFACCAMLACNQPAQNANDAAANESTTPTNDNGTPTTPEVTDVKEYERPSDAAEAKCPAPRTMRELSGGMKKLFYQFNSKNSANLALFGVANVGLSKKEVMVIVDFVQYKDASCPGGSIRFGVGARLFLHIKQIQGGIKVTDLPKLAAGVELGKASVTYSVETIGITGDAIRAALPNTGDFNVEAYGKVMSAVDRIQMLARDGQEGVVIDPQIIPIAN